MPTGPGAGRSDRPADGLLAELVRFRADYFDLPFGLGAAVFTLVPLLASLALGYSAEGVLVTFGSLNLFLATLPRPLRTKPAVAATAVVTNALAFGAGSLVAELPVGAEVAATALGVTLALVAARDLHWENLGGMAAVMFVLGIGLPVAGLETVPFRTLYVLAGGAFALAGWLVLTRWLSPLRVRSPPSAPAAARGPATLRSVLPYAVTVGATAALGLLIGLRLGLQRDYWIMLTIVIALRPELHSTLTFSVARVLGTVIGASAAFFLTGLTGMLVVLLAALALAATLAFASRQVNLTFFAIWITLVVIGLLNLLYSGGPELAATRVVDTVIGGALALLAGLLLTAARRFGGRARAIGLPPGSPSRPA